MTPNINDSNIFGLTFALCVLGGVVAVAFITWIVGKLTKQEKRMEEIAVSVILIMLTSLMLLGIFLIIHGIINDQMAV